MSAKPPKIKHASIIGSYERGNLKTIDVENRLQALRLSWMRTLLYDETEHEWKIIPTFYIEKYARNIFYPYLKIDIKSKLPTFYKNVIKVWEQIVVGNPLKMENVMVQPIRYNGKIMVNKSVIVWKEASDLFRQNFYDENGALMEWCVFEQKKW